MNILEKLVSSLQLSSTTKARKLLKNGMVRVNGVVVIRADHIVGEGDEIEVAGRRERLEARAPFAILYNDEFIVVAVKPAGLLSVDRENERSKSFYKDVNNWVRTSTQNRERVFLVHRLDREVSGAMIFAKSLQIQYQLEADWPQNEKVYYAITEGKPKELSGRIETWLAESSELKVYSTAEGANSKRAVTHYKVLESLDNRSLIEVRIETGRKHQIRVHLSEIGCPIVGDKKYGSQVNMKGRIALHALRLSVNHPVTGKRLTLTAPLPEEFHVEMSRSTHYRHGLR